MADKDDKKASKDASSATPRFDPKPVQVGGESLIERLTPHVKKIAVVLVGIAVVLTVVFTVRYFKQRDRQKMTARFAHVMEVADREVKQPGAPADPSAKEPKFDTAKDRAVAVLAEIEKQGTNLAGHAFRGSLMVQAGKLDDAIAEYKKGTSAKGIEGVLSREGLGIALEEKALAQKDAAAQAAGLEEALKAFQAMQPDEKGPRAAFAVYHQGRILAHMQKWAEARAAFEKAKTLGADSELPSIIDERLASLGGS